MAFPQQPYPQVVHLFVNQFNTLLSSGSISINSFYTACTKHCINFLSLYDIQAINLPSNSVALSNFINLGKTSYGIIDFAGSIDLYNPASNGLSRFNLIDTYNTNYPSTKINWITLENEFWNLSSKPFTAYTNACQVSNSSTVTLINGLTTSAPYFTVGNAITIDGYNRQIKQINAPTQVILDRPINTSIVSGSITIYNVSSLGMLNFDTFLDRLKTLRGLTQSKGMKIEAYLARKIPQNQWLQLVPHLDRILIENDYDKYNYCLYNDTSATKNRTILQYITTNRTGTLNITNGFNILYGTGTLFTQELGIGTKIISNGQIFTIQNIISDTQATTIETANGTILNGTFKTYTNFAPIYYINDLYPNRRSWLTGATIPNAKSIVDVYKLYTLSSYSVAGVTQSGSIPISYNNETDVSITAATNLVGISIFSRTPLQDLTPYILSGLTVSTTSFSLLLSKTDPTSDVASDGTITTNFNGAGLTPPYRYIYTSGILSYTSTTSTIPNTKTGLKSGTWSVVVKDSVNNTSNTANITLIEKFPLYTTVSLIPSGVTFLLSGGVSTYTIVTVNQQGNPDGFFNVTGLSDGTYNYTSPFVVGNTYTFNIIDSAGAVISNIVVTITVGGNLSLSINSYTDSGCEVFPSGIINVSVLGSTPPYTYVYSATSTTIVHPNVSSNTDILTNVSPDTWQIYAYNNSYTSNTETVTIVSNFSATTSTIPGVLIFNIVGGTVPYTVTSVNTTPQLTYTASSSGQFSVIIPGGVTYRFIIEDSNGCQQTVTQYVLSTSPPFINVISFVNPTGPTSTNGSILVQGYLGTPPYTYSINGGVFTSNTLFTGLTEGTYTITLMDSSTPVPRTNSVIQILTHTFNVNTYSGTNICLIATGGTAPYYVSLNDNSPVTYTSPTYTCYTGNCGYNKVVVGDINGFYFTGNTFVLCPLSFSYTATPVSCFGIENGSINITGINGIPPYQFYLHNDGYQYPLVNNTGNFQNLRTGIWTLDVTDSNTPSTTATTTVNLSQTFNVSLITNTGSTDLIISGGSQPYVVSYISIPQQFVGTQTFTAATSGTYNVTGESGTLYVFFVTDSSGCIISDLRSNIPSTTFSGAIDFNITQLNDLACDNPTTIGQILFTVTGGTSPYTYTIIDYTTNITYSAISINNTYTINLPLSVDHNYCAFLTDNNSNSATPQPFVPTSSFWTDITLSGGNVSILFSGVSAIRVSINNEIVTMGTNGFILVNDEDVNYLEYLLVCGQNNQISITGRTIDNLNQTYYCIIDDSIFVPCSLVCSVYFDPPTCLNQSIESIQFIYSGGTPGYTIELTNGVYTYTATTLADNYGFSNANLPGFYVDSGIWTFNLTDSLGVTCSYVFDVIPTFDVIITDVTSSGFCITIIGGAGGYRVGIDGNKATSVSPTITTSGDFRNNTLYCFEIPCREHTLEIKNNSYPCSITRTIDPVCDTLSCQYFYGNPSFDFTQDGSITIYVENGEPPYNFYLTNNETLKTYAFLDNPTGKYTFNYLNSGSWSSLVTSSKGELCYSDITLEPIPLYFGLKQKNKNLNLDESNMIFLSATVNESNDDKILLKTDGGTSPYEYLITNGNEFFTNNTGIFSNLNSDTWYLSVTDSSGVESNLTLIITLIDSLYVKIITDINGFCVTMTGGIQPYHIYVDGVDLGWNSINNTNCYNVDCTTVSYIMIKDSNI